MKYIKTYENYTTGTTLIVVDVQKSFRKFFTEMYIHELKKYCGQFESVYQIWDNHSEGKNVDKDYLYDDAPEIPINGDLYTFPNQKKLIEKRYNYDVDANFYKKILDKETYNLVKEKEDKKSLKRGEFFKTTGGTIIVYIGNRHNWFHCGKKLYSLFESLKGKDVTMVGGASGECLTDLIITAQSLGVKVRQDFKYIYSASHCPIK